MYARRSGGRDCRQSGSPPRSRGGWKSRQNAATGSLLPSAPSSPKRSMPAARRCATMSRRTDRSAISSIVSAYMTARASLARDRAATARYGRSCKAAARLSTVRPANANIQQHPLRETNSMAYETILVETRGRVGLITLNRPKALNALNSTVLKEVVAAAEAFDRNPRIGAMVLTGSEKAFAAGADIKEMQPKAYIDVYMEGFFGGWEQFTRIRKPVIAAVAGYALGGGCELAMMCDFIVAADNAKFGQPEIKLGVMPGAGGSQRLTRFVGKSKAMEMCLTGRMMDAEEAERSGLVSRVVPAETLLDDALKTAQTIAEMSLPIAMMTKESVNRAYETTLSEGVRFERRLFHSMFATDDQSEGMAAFIEKRKPQFRNR